MSARLYFVLKGAAPTVDVLAEDLADSQRDAPRQGENLRAPRRPGGRMKLLDENAIEHMLHGRRTVHVPSFSMIDEEGAEYPESTDDRLCQWDHYPIHWRPVGMPFKKMVIAQKARYTCVRWFCSLECARKHWKIHHQRDPIFSKTLKYLDEMHKSILRHLNQPYTPLGDALDWNLLKGVGSGHMEIDDFRSAWAERYQKEFTFLMHKAIEVYTRQTT
jgi:hypothetical protein